MKEKTYEEKLAIGRFIGVWDKNGYRYDWMVNKREEQEAFDLGLYHSINCKCQECMNIEDSLTE